MLRWHLRVLVVAGLVLAGLGATLAGFSAVADNPANSVTGAADWVPPTVTMSDPGANLRGTVTLAATASDAGGSGVASVRIQRSPAGAGTWTDVCTDTSSPYNCSLDTTTLTDGLYDFRAIATDVDGNTNISVAVTNRLIDNTLPSATMTDPGANLSGTVTLGATATDAGSGVASVRIQRSPAGAGTWTDVCTDTTAPYNCSLDTTTLANGLYDLRAISTDNAGNTRTSTTVTNRRIDNTAPTVTMTNPGANLRGTITLGATASDTGGSGLASVTIQRSVAGAGIWVDVCTDTTTPYNCSLDTTTLADGLYDLRAIATDNAGNSTTSAIVTNRRIDNTAPSANMTDPGSPLSGTVALSGDGADMGSGLASLKLQYKLSSDSTWIDHCTSASSPLSCPLDTTTLADGAYDFRALSTDNAGNTANTTYTSRIIDNDPPSVIMNDPGANLSGTVALGATATDAGSGVASVRIQRSPAGAGTWTDVCTDTSSPYNCSLDTTTLPEGSLHDFRAIATDNAGRTTTSATVANRLVDNSAPTVLMTDPGSPLRGSVTLASTNSDGGSGVVSVRYQTSPAGANTWSDACTGTTSPFSCSFNTASLADGLYDVRAIATDAAGNSATSTPIANRRIDNTAPSSSMTDPGNNLRGTITLSGTGADAGSGLASLMLQYKLTSDSTWIDHCTSASSPLSCSLDTTTLADGVYDFRALSTDNAGNTAATTYTSRRIDNTAPSVTATAIQKSTGGSGDFIRQGASYYVYANVTETGSGLSSVTGNTSSFDTGVTATTLSAGSWTVDGVSYNRRSAVLTANGTLANGSYAFSVTATDAATNSSTANDIVTVDNTAPTAVDIQTANVGGGTAGKPELGDTVTWTYSEQMDANLILSGWTGASTSVVVRIDNINPDELEVWNSSNGTQTRLGNIALGRSDYVGGNRTFGLSGTASTMVMSGSTITVTLGTASGTTTTAAGTGQMQWRITGTEDDRAGNNILAGNPFESGAADVDF